MLRRLGDGEHDDEEHNFELTFGFDVDGDAHRDHLPNIWSLGNNCTVLPGKCRRVMLRDRCATYRYS